MADAGACAMCSNTAVTYASTLTWAQGQAQQAINEWNAAQTATKNAQTQYIASDLNMFLTWCAGQELDPLNLGRAEVERYVRSLQEVRRYQPSTVSRRLSVVVRFYRVCVIDQILTHSLADYDLVLPVEADLTGR